MKVFIIVALLLTGCGGGKFLKIDRGYKLHDGMSVGEVTEYLNNARVTPLGNNKYIFSYAYNGLGGEYFKTAEVQFDDKGLSTGLGKGKHIWEK